MACPKEDGQIILNKLHNNGSNIPTNLDKSSAYLVPKSYQLILGEWRHLPSHILVVIDSGNKPPWHALHLYWQVVGTGG